jgi:hypothetical protein
MKNASPWLTGVLVLASIIYLVSVGWLEKRSKRRERGYAVRLGIEPTSNNDSEDTPLP